VIVCVCHNCGTVSYSFSLSNQTDQGDETEGLKREGLKMERYERDRSDREGMNGLFTV
jgi:hypothetical protein